MARSLLIKFILIAMVFASVSCSNKEEQASDKKVAEIENSIKQGILFISQLQFEKAHEELTYALGEAREVGAKKQEVQAMLNLGVLYDTFNDTEQAIYYFLKSLELAQKYQIEEVYNSVYNNVAIGYSKNSNFEEAEHYFRLALKKSIENNDSSRIAINWINIAQVKSDLNQMDSSLYYTQKTLTIKNIKKSTRIHYMVYNNLGELYYKMADFELAKQYFLKALKIANEEDYLTDIALLELNIGKTFVNIHKYDSADYYLNKAIGVLIQANNSELISDCYYWLYKNESEVNLDADSKLYIDECLAWKDSSMVRKKNKWITDIKLKFEFQKKQQEIEYLEERASTQRLIIFSIIFFSILFIIFIISIWQSRNKNLKQRNLILKKEKEVNALEKEKNELKQLKLEEEIFNQKKLSKINEKQAKLEIEHKNREVTSRAIHLLNKNEILISIQDLIERLNQKSHDPILILKEVKSIVRNNLSQDKTWDDLKLQFEEVHEGFANKLKENHPDLSPTDFRLCAYLLMELSSKEIANISNITPESVRKRKQRLRQKLNLNSTQSIEEYLKSL